MMMPAYEKILNIKRLKKIIIARHEAIFIYA
ncbi:hypothetical protein EV200_101538 [Pedobacter psychrotolerans]|uniref:Uncharacterized protein n=1 Tax=Pedobacter psychrotolerans TaxID=1843235 RepID=A0A4R2HQJ5_9SPHI|nr:hypothetical protein EV200_101538 [Pedobacter psychrotolerans]